MVDTKSPFTYNPHHSTTRIPSISSVLPLSDGYLWPIQEMILDYFEILEVDKSASQADIKKSFRRLAAKYHPDRNTSEDAIERFQHIQESYSVLSDPKKRTKYIEQEYTEVLNPKEFTASYWNQCLNA